MTANDLAAVATEVRRLTGETQGDFGRRIGYTGESIQRFENPRFGIGNARALLAYAHVARSYGRDDLCKTFGLALLGSLGEGSEELLRWVLLGQKAELGMMYIPQTRQGMIERLLHFLDHPATDFERRTGEFIIDLLNTE
jgi:hypothetical protein